MERSYRIARVGPGCTACGCCAGVCPRGAVYLPDGAARVVETRCAGCGLCARICPEGVITMAEWDPRDRRDMDRSDGSL